VSLPRTIGRYRIERLIGQGAMGSVYLGRDPQLDRAVAVKTVRDLDLDEDRQAAFLERFRNEARAAARLTHAAIVAVYDVGEDDAVGPFLVFEYVAGSTLKAILKARGPMPPADVIRIGRAVAGALDTAHRAHVIHRDVKPDNILVDADGRAKLADFGVARVPDAALTKEGQFLGTPCYAAPETLERGEYGARTDLFSFAAVLYEMVSGVRAFPGDEALAVVQKVINETPPAASETAEDGASIPVEVDAILTRGLDKDPDRRFEAALPFVEALHAAYIEAGLLEPDPTGTHVLPRPIEPPGRGPSNLPFALVIAGGLALGLAGLLIFGGEEGPLPPPPPSTPDAGVLEDAGVDAGPGDAGAPSEEPPPPSTPDAGIVDAGAADGGVDGGLAALSRFEREELAKDLVDEARRRLAAGDLAGALESLRQARVYDPELEDLEAVRAQVLEATPTPPEAAAP
jgi:tRNA A-37 threonylcarbamoyl transferase component Bud32